MSEMLERNWPEAKLNDVERLRVLAAGLSGAVLAERVFEHPIEKVWGLAGDLENGTKQIELGVRSATITSRDGDRLKLHAQTVVGIPLEFDVELRFGWCLMQSKTSCIGMAAIEEEPGRTTRFAHFEGTGRWGRILRPLFRWNIRGDLKRMTRILRAS